MTFNLKAILHARGAPTLERSINAQGSNRALLAGLGSRARGLLTALANASASNLLAEDHAKGHVVTRTGSGQVSFTFEAVSFDVGRGRGVTIAFRSRDGASLMLANLTNSQLDEMTAGVTLSHCNWCGMPVESAEPTQGCNQCTTAPRRTGATNPTVSA